MTLISILAKVARHQNRRSGKEVDESGAIMSGEKIVRNDWDNGHKI